MSNVTTLERERFSRRICRPRGVRRRLDPDPARIVGQIVEHCQAEDYRAAFALAREHLDRGAVTGEELWEAICSESGSWLVAEADAIRDL